MEQVMGYDPRSLTPYQQARLDELKRLFNAQDATIQEAFRGYVSGEKQPLGEKTPPYGAPGNGGYGTPSQF